MTVTKRGRNPLANMALFLATLATGLAPKPAQESLIAVPEVQAAQNPHQGTEITATSGVTFIYYTQRMTWPNAARFCAQHHSKLAVVMNAEDNALLADVITSSNTAARGSWLGATSLDVNDELFTSGAPAYRLRGVNRQHSTNLQNWHWYPDDGLGDLASRQSAGAYANWAQNEPNNGGNPSREPHLAAQTLN